MSEIESIGISCFLATVLAGFGIIMACHLNDERKFNGWRRVALIVWIVMWAFPPLARLYIALIL